jgi:putative copper export protein
LNRRRFGPALQHGGVVAARRFRQVVAIEFVLLAAILCVTAVMTTFYSPEAPGS